MRHLTLALLILVLPLHASAQRRGIAAEGIGAAAAAPAAYVIRGSVEVSAATAGEAIAKFRAASARARKALGSLDGVGIEIEGAGPVFRVAGKKRAGGSTQEIVVNGGAFIAFDSVGAAPSGKSKEPVTLAEDLTIRVTGLAELSSERRLAVTSSVIDVATEIGLIRTPTLSRRGREALAPEPIAAFEPAERAALLDEAVSMALKKARARAAAIAEMAGVTAGPILAVRVDPTRAVWTRSAGECRCEIVANVVIATN